MLRGAHSTLLLPRHPQPALRNWSSASQSAFSAIARVRMPSIPFNGKVCVTIHSDRHVGFCVFRGTKPAAVERRTVRRGPLRVSHEKGDRRFPGGDEPRDLERVREARAPRNTVRGEGRRTRSGRDRGDDRDGGVRPRHCRRAVSRDRGACGRSAAPWCECLAAGSARARHLFRREEVLLRVRGATGPVQSGRPEDDGAPWADGIFVSARTSGGQRDAQGVGVFYVPAGTKGLSLRSYVTIDGRRAAEVMLEGVELGADAAIGDPADGLALVERALDAHIAATPRPPPRRASTTRASVMAIVLSRRGCGARRRR